MQLLTAGIGLKKDTQMQKNYSLRSKNYNSSTSQVDNVISDILLSHVTDKACKLAAKFLDRAKSNGKIGGTLIAALPYFCVQLACELDSCPFDEKLAIKKSTLVEKEYRRGYALVGDLLGVNSAESFQSQGKWMQRLAVHFDCLDLVARCESLHEIFSERYLNSLSAAERQHANLQLPIYSAATFLAVAKASKRRISAAKVASFVQIAAKVLTPLLKTVESLCVNELTGAETAPKTPRKKRTRSAGTEEEIKAEATTPRTSRVFKNTSPLAKTPTTSKTIHKSVAALKNGDAITPRSRIAQVKQILQESTFNTPTMGQSRKRQLSAEKMDGPESKKTLVATKKKQTILYGIAAMNPMILNPSILPTNSKQYRLFINVKDSVVDEIKSILSL